MIRLLRFIPNMMTLTNAMLGVLAIYFVSHQSISWAAMCMGLALILDFLDGFVARLLNVQGELGKQLDSLADMITFGALPGYILFQMIAVSRGLFFQELYLWSFIDILACGVGLLVPAAAALRLGVFNLDDSTKDYFTGLPTPAMAIFVISFPLILEAHYHLNFFSTINESLLREVAVKRHWKEWDVQMVMMLQSPMFYQLLAVTLAVLMNAKLPMIALKFQGLSWKKNRWKYSVLIWVLLAYFIFLIPYLRWLKIDIGLIDYWIAPIIMLGYFILSFFYAIFAVRKSKTA